MRIINKNIRDNESGEVLDHIIAVSSWGKKYYFRLPPKPLFNIHHDLKNIEDPYEKIEVIGLENKSLNAGQNTEVTVCVLGISISDSDLTRFYSCEKPNRGCAEYY